MTISALSVDLQRNRVVTKLLHKEEEVSHDSISSLDSAVDAHIEKQFRGFQFLCQPHSSTVHQNQ